MSATIPGVGSVVAESAEDPDAGAAMVESAALSGVAPVASAAVSGLGGIEAIAGIISHESLPKFSGRTGPIEQCRDVGEADGVVVVMVGAWRRFNSGVRSTAQAPKSWLLCAAWLEPN